ncbi:caspase-1-like [Vanessa cardui]|uniref:caspase-1-like n=1 Tax=Vanessa cardui TaxID=171605 RepID=UPI001F134A6D|nr:caspase-1-like [Vanessa cardui]
MENEEIMAYIFSRDSHDGEMSSLPQISDENSDDDAECNDKVTSEPGTPIAEFQKTPYNTRALSKNDSTYRLESFQKHYMMIFNQENIDGFKPRLGTEKDVSALCRTFSEYNFEIDVHKDLTKLQIMEELRILSEKDWTDYGCIVIAVLTHGTYGGLLRAKDMQYTEGEIINHFKTHDKPTLLTKPKFLIVQACRGTRPIQGMVVARAGKIRKDIDKDEEPYTLPIESDMLILHSSYSGNPSHRDELHGSWLIQALCAEITNSSPALDLESIITVVKRKVAIDMSHKVYNRQTYEMDINKQMPVMTSTLIRKLYLRKYNDEQSSPEAYCDKGVIGQNEVFDGEVSGAPLFPQLGPCFCFLNHYTYLKKCLRYVVAENSEDRVAQSYLDISETLEDSDEFNATKEKLATLISEHLSTYDGSLDFYKYLYLYKRRL